MSDEMDKMVDAFWEAGSWWTDDVESPGTELLCEMIAAALAAVPAVQGYVLCEGHHVAPAGHCYFHGSRFCGDPECGPCPGPFQDLIARRRAKGTT
jgi:hypothetical protein